MNVEVETNKKNLLDTLFSDQNTACLCGVLFGVEQFMIDIKNKINEDIQILDGLECMSIWKWGESRYQPTEQIGNIAFFRDQLEYIKKSPILFINEIEYVVQYVPQIRTIIQEREKKGLKTLYTIQFPKNILSQDHILYILELECVDFVRVDVDYIQGSKNVIKEIDTRFSEEILNKYLSKTELRKKLWDMLDIEKDKE